MTMVKRSKKLVPVARDKILNNRERQRKPSGVAHYVLDYRKHPIRNPLIRRFANSYAGKRPVSASDANQTVKFARYYGYEL